MAKISVQEKDLSWYYRQRRRGALTVYMPGLATFGPDVPMYVTEDNFVGVFGSPLNIRNDYSFYLAKSLIKSGIDVLFHRVMLPGAAAAIAESKADSSSDEYVSFGGYALKVTNSSDAAITVTVTVEDDEGNTDTKNFSFDPGENDVRVDEKFEEALVTAIASEASLEVTGDPELTSSVTIEAKYPGSFGNQLSTTVKYAQAGIRYFTTRVTNTQGNTYVVEQLIVDFANPMSQYYFENVDSAYLNFDVEIPDGKAFDDSILNPKSMSATIIFKNGKDYDVKPDEEDEGFSMIPSLQDATVKVKNTDIIKEAIYQMTKDGTFFDIVKDPYGYYFDIVVNGGLCLQSVEKVETEDPVTGEVTVTIYNEFQEERSNSETGEVTQREGLNYSLDKLLVKVAESGGNANNEGGGLSVYLIGGGRGTVQDAAQFKTYCGRFNTSFASGIGPWGFSQLVSEGSRVWLPGWYAQLIEWGNSIARGNPIWFAPAGTQRARVGSIIQRPDYEIGAEILDTWQNQDYTTSNDGDYKLNPIMFLKQYGYCVYGNSTLLHSRFDGSTSMLQSLGTRILVNQIKARAFDIALGLQFDQLTENLFFTFKELMSVYMDRLRYQGGLYDYQILIDKSSMTFDNLNQRTVPVLIRISPNPAAEIFNITCEVYPSGITFTDEFDETSVIA